MAAAACYGLALWKVPDLMGHGGLTDPRDRHNARLLVVEVPWIFRTVIQLRLGCLEGKMVVAEA
jgi:hypothetical protein